MTCVDELLSGLKLYQRIHFARIKRMFAAKCGADWIRTGVRVRVKSAHILVVPGNYRAGICWRVPPGLAISGIREEPCRETVNCRIKHESSNIQLLASALLLRADQASHINQTGGRAGRVGNHHVNHLPPVAGIAHCRFPLPERSKLCDRD